MPSFLLHSIPISLIARWPLKIWRALSLSQSEKQYHDAVRGYFSALSRSPVSRNLPPSRSRTILFQRPYDHFFLMRFLPLLEHFRRAPDTEIQFVNLRFYFEPYTKLDRVKRWITDCRWAKAYRTRWGEDIGLDFNCPIPKNIMLDARRIQNDLHTREDLVSLNVRGLLIGDLINDTYLRFKPAATVDISDPLLTEVIAQSLMMHNQIDDYLTHANVQMVFTTYGSYIHHGILVRMALAKGVRVFALGALDPFLRELDKSLPSHVRNYPNYARGFSLLSDEEKKSALKQARAFIDGRFQGQVDAGSSYMKTSAYALQTDEESTRQLEDLCAERRPKILIYLHCFFDSPHIYRHMLFPDFLAWLQFLFDEASKYPEIQVYVRPHPNGMDGNEQIVQALLKKYSSIRRIPATLSNRILVQAGFAAAFTAYGTVAHELPFFGVPVVCAGDNPHIDYAFCQHSKSHDELSETLKQIASGEFKPSIDQDQILEFIYMHNLYPHRGRGDEDARDMLSEINAIRTFDEKVFAEKVAMGPAIIGQQIDAMLAASRELLPEF